MLFGLVLGASGGGLAWSALGIDRALGAAAAPRVELTATTTFALGGPALVAALVGFAIGARTAPRFGRAVLAGLLVVALAQLAGWRLAALAPFDTNVANAVLGAAALGGLVLAGASVAVVARRVGFAEVGALALTLGYLTFGSLAIGAHGLLARSSVPPEQSYLVLAVLPTAAALVFLTVGASLGFLLFGDGGRVELGFGFELLTALRYLKLRPSRRLVVGAAILPFVAGLLSGSWMVATALAIPVLGILAVAWLGTRAATAPATRERRSPFVGLTLVISVGGVCVGVMALIVVLSVMGGFEEDVKSKLLGAHAHVAITKIGDDFVEYGELEGKLARVDDVDIAASFILAEGMIATDAGLAGTLVKGLDVRNSAALRDLAKNVERGDLDGLARPETIGAKRRLRGAALATSTTATTTGLGRPIELLQPIATFTEPTPARVLPGIVIGREMARTLRVFVGDTVSLVSPASEELGPNGPTPKLRRFRVAAIFFSGMYEFDSKFSYVDLAQAQRFFAMRDRVTGVELRLGDVGATSRVVEDVKRRVGGYPYQVRDWRDMNRELFSALLLEKLAMFIVLSFIVLVASFLIVSTLVMIVLEKAREIAILKSMGASDASIMKIFVIQGLFVGFGGATLGLVLGVSICVAIERLRVSLDPDIFYITQLPVVMDTTEIGAVIGAAVVITYLASIFPALAAARLSPVDGLRED